MTLVAPHVHHVHNAACETAALASCHCFCHGAGHQNDLVVRAAKCATTADHATLAANLLNILGGFHTSFRDVATRTRGGRNVLTTREAASLGNLVRRGATWYETLIVDEALHAMFLLTASNSQAASVVDRDERRLFVERITSGAIVIVRSPAVVANVAESHVWCSIVAEFISGLVPMPPGQALPAIFDDICYPRLTTGRRPGSLAAVKAAGLAHLDSAYAASPLSPSMLLELLQLVAAATCPDIWHHPAVARFAVRPVVMGASWPPPRTTTIVKRVHLDELQRRWARRGHW
jgi:hypothetical protein